VAQRTTYQGNMSLHRIPPDGKYHDPSSVRGTGGVTATLSLTRSQPCANGSVILQCAFAFAGIRDSGRVLGASGTTGIGRNGRGERWVIIPCSQPRA
jgi:hypothetical protein